jgi:hypothetical protein
VSENGNGKREGEREVNERIPSPQTDFLQIIPQNADTIILIRREFNANKTLFLIRMECLNQAEIKV